MFFSLCCVFILVVCALSCSFLLFFFCFFFFKQNTAYEMRISDWSSDVCSSDLDQHPAAPGTDPAGRCRQRRLFDQMARRMAGEAGRVAKSACDPLAEDRKSVV